MKGETNSIDKKVMYEREMVLKRDYLFIVSGKLMIGEGMSAETSFARDQFELTSIELFIKQINYQRYTTCTQ